ncbi:MAG TPA: sigma-70 family RNA polymerase sigma factor [Acidimicrobiales bacterium]
MAGGIEQCTEFEDWFRALYSSALGVACRLLRDPAEAEDAVAEAFARALVAWRRIRGLPYRDAWLLRVVANVAIDQARRHRHGPPVDAWVEAHDDIAVLRLALSAALRALPRRQREAIVLRYLAGLSTAEVASYLQISPESVKEHVARGVVKLRDRLGPQWKEPNLVTD